jgi:hypothetical protein
MKARMWICVLMAVGIALAAAAATARDNPKPRPFSGTLVGDVFWENHGEDACPSQGGFLTMSAATGEMSHLGRATMTEEHCAGFDGLPLNGTAIFVAANGDKMWAAAFIPCAWSDAPPPMFAEECNYIVAGGTGRFATASGSLHLKVYVTPTGDPTQDPSIHFPAKFVWVGKISY